MTRFLQLLGSIGVAVALTLGTAVITGAHVDATKACAVDSSGRGGGGHN
jgi:hypothetical protein